MSTNARTAKRISPKSRSNFSQSLPIYLILLLGMIAIGTLQLPQLRKIQQQGQTLSPKELKEAEQSAKANLALLREVPTFGFDNLIANWTILEFFEYFGDNEAREVTGYDLSLDYFDVIIDRDPRFLAAYNGLATSGSIYAARPEETNTLIEKGLQSVTPKVPFRSYYILRHKGINEILFLPNSQEDARKSFETAAEWANSYSDEESQYVAELSRQTAQYLANNPESKTAKVSAWVMVLQAIPPSDKSTRKRAIREIEKLGGKVVQTPEGNWTIQPPETD
ncbi:hypothetical protein [Lusitaniella coriacea]|uniref:hypothetical protein n=1 Tax=Lusitaniella coriacea TaxID=1983105 RepID=UPI003CED0CCC